MRRHPGARDLPSTPVTVYWRPGCGFCSSLLRGLERAGLAFERTNIWEDPEAAAFVRSVADGNETVRPFGSVTSLWSIRRHPR